MSKLDGKWIEIFRGGPQYPGGKTSGQKPVDGTLLIKQIMDSFDSKVFKPSVTIGHPISQREPSYGWVGALKTEMDQDNTPILFAQLQDTIPEFSDLVEKKMFPNRSATIRSDGFLENVAFLGGVAPAVKGLAEIEFSDSTDKMYFEFSMLSAPLEETEQPKEVSMTQEEMEKYVATKEKEFEAKLQTQLDTQKAELTSHFSTMIQSMEFAAIQKDIATFIDTEVKNGKITPAAVESGIQEFMFSLAHGNSFEFAEKKVSSLDWFKSFLGGQTGLSLLKEVDTKEERYEKKGDLTFADQAEKIRIDRKLTYTEAFQEAAKLFDFDGKGKK